MSCLQCKSETNSKFCSSKCRGKHWRINNKDRVSEYAKQYRRKTTIVYCVFCNNEISDNRRGNYIFTCSDKCDELRKRQEEESRKEASKRYKNKKRDEFLIYKEDIGCSRCGYNKYGGSLDFHHLDPSTKLMRITSTNYNKQEGIDEMQKCSLVCKNCHYEIHGDK